MKEYGVKPVSDCESENHPLAVEEAVELYANGKIVSVLMCTPSDLAELGWGHLAARGLVPATPLSRLTKHPHIKVCTSRSKIEIECELLSSGSAIELGTVIASGCGSGVRFSQNYIFRPALSSLWQTSLPALRTLSDRMFSTADAYRATGGMHIAAMARNEGGNPWFVAREDVGRHNAVDKVIGATLIAGFEPSDCVLLTSGRIAADMVLKAVAAEIPIVVSRSIPTTTAYEIAQRSGITLIGRIGSSHPVLYTHRQRIFKEESCSDA